VPVPPSRQRPVQPVLELARGLADALSLPFLDVVTCTRTDGGQLKDTFDYRERIRLLEHAFEVEGRAVHGKSVLLVDDLYRSGATLDAVSAALHDIGGVSAVYVFAATRTRSRA